MKEVTSLKKKPKREVAEFHGKKKFISFKKPKRKVAEFNSKKIKTL